MECSQFSPPHIYISDHIGMGGGRVDSCKHRGMYAGRGRCKLDFHFFLYCTAHEKTFPESQLLEAWPAIIYGHLRECMVSNLHTCGRVQTRLSFFSLLYGMPAPSTECQPAHFRGVSNYEEILEHSYYYQIDRYIDIFQQ